MRTSARAVVIGGGIAGCSALYHLTREGWTDVVLLERDEITSGTTWHSAAQVKSFGMNQTMVALKARSIALYRDLAADPDHPVGYNHGDGGIRLAGDERTMEGYRHFASMAEGMGQQWEVIDAAECARRHPLLSTGGIVGGLWDPHDGHIDPTQLCNALLARARRAGAEVHRRCPVMAIARRGAAWVVTTPQGEIEAEVVVNAGGYRCNEIAAMMGHRLPVASMEHQYFVTEDMPEVRDAGQRIPLIRCPISDFYARQERDGLLVGFYEQDCRTWGLDGIDPGFTMDLSPDDLDRVMPVIEGAMARMPALATAGIKQVVNGPITYTIDGAPLVGPIPGLGGAYCITGLRAGLGEGGGHGWLLAQMIVHGAAEVDTWCLDPRRFLAHATVAYTAEKAVEDYRNEFRFHFPHEHRPAGRPVRTTPLTETLVADGARMGVVAGWERVEYAAPEGFAEDHSFRFTNAEPLVAAEVRAVSEDVAITEVSGFSRFELTGADVVPFLQRLSCSRVPTEAGKVGLTYWLDDRGCLRSEVTVANVAPGRVWLGSAAAAQWHDRDWMRAHLRAGEDVRVADLTTTHAILLLAGPRSREVLSAAARGDWSAEAFPWLSVREAEVGIAPATVMSVSFSGELAYEIHVPSESLSAAYRALRAAGATTLFGSRAVESMRLEKSFLHWKAEVIDEVDPHEAGLSRFVRAGGGYVGAAALAARTPARRLVTLAVEADDAPPHAGASVRDADAVVGTVTSGGKGHRTGLVLALAYVRPDRAAAGTALAVDVLGTARPARVIPPSPYDPGFRRVRDRGGAEPAHGAGVGLRTARERHDPVRPGADGPG
ncbi:FAD-dependent oxidoreductase [Jannaschia sp. Os4]|uniref:GcvT family protein n=1 Tax=Jannaschia sp. Os4 TaxID=2807617 RepID=UPI0019392DF5|nr:FAD-dependent oxidoreductase [Jannaschia sp. Os4]MBM2575933.1 FAD-dependent oxidoreductase [Jannaschia sp. Os4]